jgi:hypothetical protein
MNRDKRPEAAIGEAKRKAMAGGFQVIGMARPEELAFDFAVQRDGVTSLVRVRRLKQAGFRVANILRACARQIRELRECTLFKGSERELWVRGPARAYHRFRVLPETLEELPDPGVPPAPAGTGDLPETPPVPWHERSISTDAGEVREVPYVRESPAKRERLNAMFRGYAKYRAGLPEKETLPGGPGSGTVDPGAGAGTTTRDPESGDPDRGAADPV